MTTAHVLLIFFSFLFAFHCFKIFDEQSVVGPTGRLTALTEENHVDPRVFFSELEKFALEKSIDIAVVEPDPASPLSGENIHPIRGEKAPGSTLSMWEKHGYPHFSRDTERAVLPPGNLANRDPRISYFIFGDEGKVQSVQNFFSAKGFTWHYEKVFSWEKAFSFFLTGHRLICASLTVLLVCLLSLSGVLYDAKRYAILSLHGHTIEQQVFFRARQSIQQIALFFTIGATISAAGLWLYNRLNYFPIFIGLSLFILAVTSVAMIAVQTITLWLVARLPVVEGVKGKLPFKSAHALTYLVRIPTLFLIIMVVQSSSIALHAVEQAEQNSRRSLLSGESYSGTLSMATQNPEDEDKVAAYLREAEEKGDIFVASKVSLSGTPEAMPIRMVNHHLWQRLRSHDHTLPQLPSAPDGSKAYLIAPAGFSRNISSVEEQLRSKNILKNKEVQIHQIISDHDLDYAPAATGGAHLASIPRQALLVVSAGVPLLGDRNAVAALSRGELFFADKSAAERMLASEVTWALAGIGSTAQLNAAIMAAPRQALQISYINGGLSLVMLVISSLAVATTHMARYRQRDFVRRLFGWTVLQSNPVPIFLEVGLTSAVAAWAIDKFIASQVPASDVPGAPPPLPDAFVPTAVSLFVTLGVLVLSVALFIWTLHRLSDRSLKNLSAQP
ncbi:bacteriocin-associated integral membrane family protein [Austwickia chelonae]|uniref:bacteriocin-associated integral membrane family protein n=1 Tax=Austwickia chelonae TaxID=100225 RepID=UPI0013C351E7|nr:hypothetical protein [Austwickia chelonae]